VPIYGAETWALNKDIAKRLADFRRRVLRRMFEGIKVVENCRERINAAVWMFRFTSICQNKSFELVMLTEWRVKGKQDKCLGITHREVD
jgi:hypothetical protein